MEDKESKSNQEKTKIADDFIFSKEKVNIGHQPEFDYFKTLLVVIMILLHFYEDFSKDSFFIIIDFVGFFLEAPGFMMLMGIGMKYSRHNEINNYISRGNLLLTEGQFLYLLRNALPNLIAWWVTGNQKFISRALLVFQTDILTFAGLSFFFFALLKKKNLSDNSIMIIGIIMNIIGFFLSKIREPSNCFLLNQLIGLFVLTNAEAYFPLYSYFIFVAIGYWLGGIYQTISNKDKFYNIILIFCLPIATIYSYLRIIYKFPMIPDFLSDEDYCLFPLPGAIVACLVNLVILAFCHKIDKMLKGKTPYFIRHTGKNVNKYYIIHFIIIMSMSTFLRATRGEDYPSKIKYPTIYAIMILIVCKITIDMNDKYIHFTIVNLKNPLKNIVFSIIWIMTIISVIYIYPKVEVYATLWNHYMYET